MTGLAERTGVGAAPRWRRVLLECVLVVLLALAARLAYNEPTVHHDEFFHMQAARSLLAIGEPRLGEGHKLYTRAELYTWITAGSFRLLGESVFAARLPSILAGALLAGVVYGWFRRRTTPLAAVLGTGLGALSTEGLAFSNFCRFYMLQALLMTTAAVVVDTLLRRFRAQGPRSMLQPTSVALAVLGLAATLVSAKLQMTTFLIAAVLGAWAAAVVVVTLERTRPLGARGAWLLLLLAAAAPAAWWLAWSGNLARLYANYRMVADWAAAHQDDVGFYLDYLWTWYAPLVVATPLLAALAVRRFGTTAGFVLWVAVAGLVLHSFGGFKNMRYVFWAMVFLHALWGLGLAAALELGWAGAARLARRLPGAAWPRAALAGFVVVAALGLAYGSHRTYSYYLSRGLLTGEPRNNPFRHADWQTAHARLRPYANQSDVLLTDTTVKALYYYGGQPLAPGDRATGRPARFTAHRPGSILFLPKLRRAMEDYPTGLIIVEDQYWRRYADTPDGRLILERAQSIPLPGRLGVHAFHWSPPTELAGGTETASR